VRSGRPGSCGTGSPVSVAVTTSRLPDGAKTCGSVPGGTPIAPPRPQPGPDNVVLHGEWIACPNHVGLEAATADITGDPGVELTGRCTEEVDFRSGVGGLELLDYRLDCRVVDACVERDRCRVVVATSLPQAPRTQSCSRAVSHTICRRLIMFITVASPLRRISITGEHSRRGRQSPVAGRRDGGRGWRSRSGVGSYYRGPRGAAAVAGSTIRAV
jgi:hypothetical protein